MAAMQKKATDNFTGVEIKIHNAYLYIPTGADTFFTVPKIFNYDRPNIYDRIEIGNYPFFKSLRMTINDMTRHYNQLICSMEITGFNNGIQKFHFKLIYENNSEFIRICSSIVANVAYFVASTIDKYDMVQVYGHSIGSEEEGDFILDISNDFTYTFKLDDGDWLNNLLLVAHTDMRGIAYSYEVNNEFDEWAILCSIQRIHILNASWHSYSNK